MRHYHQNYPLSVMARLLGVSVTGYFDWLHRKPSKRQREREQALKLVTAAHEATRESYSAVRLHQHLRNQGHSLSLHRVRSLREAMAFAVNAINALKTPRIATIKSLCMTIISNNNLR
jgi:putative transposase